MLPVIIMTALILFGLGGNHKLAFMLYQKSAIRFFITTLISEIS